MEMFLGTRGTQQGNKMPKKSFLLTVLITAVATIAVISIILSLVSKTQNSPPAAADATITSVNTAPQAANTALQAQQNAPVAPSLPGNPGLPRINGSVPVLDAVGVSNPPANSAAPASPQNNYAEFAAENSILKDFLTTTTWMHAYTYKFREPDLDVRKVLEQRFALEEHIKGLQPGTYKLEQTGAQISQGSKIGTYELSGWFASSLRTKQPAGERLAAVLTVTYTNGKITNLAFR